MAVRVPAVAGRFYPRNPEELAETIRRFVADSPSSHGTEENLTVPKGLIVPHAGYVYSGSVAGHVYALLEPHRSSIQRVVLIGPSHYVPFEGIGLTSADSFQTPLGSIPIDTAMNAELMRFPFVSLQDEAHAPEHSLEVQLPFLRASLDDFTLVPMVYGRVTAAEIAEVLRFTWGGPETLIVVSSDLSHFLDETSCRRTDGETARILESLDVGRLSPERACGAKGIQGLMMIAREGGLKLRTVELKNSGDASGDYDRVVGYGGFSLSASDDLQNPSLIRSRSGFKTH